MRKTVAIYLIVNGKIPPKPQISPAVKRIIVIVRIAFHKRSVCICTVVFQHWL